MATYENYLEYIKTEFSKINPNELSEDEKEYYEVVKRDLENSNTLPSRILKSPVLSNEHLNNETINNIKIIQSKTGVYRKINSAKEWFTIKKASHKEGVFSLTLKFALVAISIVISYAFAVSYPIKINLNTPILTWEESDLNVLPNPTDEPIFPLAGTAGENDQDNKTKSYTIEILWNQLSLNLTFFIWGIIPIITILFVIYAPIIKWGWAK